MTDGERLEFDNLRREVKNLRIQLQALSERVDTVFSWPWKRIWWFFQGYRWFHVGRWYKKTEDLK